jgi:hypothetical protein
MKVFFSIVIFLFNLGISFSQEIKYSEDSSGKIVAKDQYGNIIATGALNYAGNFVWKDNSGNVLKTESISYDGKIIIKDSYGNMISSIKTDYAGNQVEKDQYGNVLYTYSTNYVGDIIQKDKYGNKVATIKSNSNGNIVVKTNNQLNNGNYSNPTVFIPSSQNYYKIDSATASALGYALGTTLTGFSLYVGFNDGYNFGFNSWHGHKAYWGFHYGSKSIKDSQYGNNTRTEMGANFGFFLSKNKKIVFKSSWGITDLYHDDYEAFPQPNPQQTYAQWEAEYNKWNAIEYDKLYYKIGLQFPLGKKPGYGLAPEIYIASYGIGFGLEYIFNIKNAKYNN